MLRQFYSTKCELLIRSNFSMLRILNFCSSPELYVPEVLIFWADFTDLGFGEE